ncbi:extracellular solute-binding protein [Actinomadura soli]|uniref:Extracellular solute-binding protein n=2 Tax=Actinomadura soli TaxID=2508997 RepID=A0A5C4J3A1_9ACTN|nr:extracellular solute-binding protein [Actinomadura soli]
MNRHLLGVVAAGLTVALSAGGCGKGSSSSDDSDGKSIKFVAAIYDEKAQPYWDALIKKFESKNSGYKVNLEMVDWTQMDAKVKTYVQTKQVPDVLNYNAFSDFARDGLVYKASEVVSPATLGDFTPTFVEQAKYNGEQYGIPFISSARLLFYNKPLFAKAGITGPPKTWNEVRANAEKIKKAGAIGYGLPLGPEEAQVEFYSWAMNNGGGWVDASGKWAINQKANVDTLAFLKDLNKSGLTQPNPESTDRKTVFNQFAQGRIGMSIGGPFTKAGFIEPVTKNLDFGVAPLPSRSGNEHNTPGVMDVLVAFKKAGGKNKDAIKKFLDFVYQKENTSKFLTTEGFLPVTRSAGDALSADPYMKQFVDALPASRFAPTSNPAWSAVAGAVKQDLGASVADDDPKKVLDKIQETAEKAG